MAVGRNEKRGAASLGRPFVQSVGLGAALVEIKSKALKTVKVTIASPTANDTFNVIQASVYMMAGSNVRGLLPLPVPPSN